MYGYDHAGWMFGGGLLMRWWLVPLALVIAFGLIMFRPGAALGAMGKGALDILKERCASGDIGKDEFDQKKRDLGC